MSRFEEVLRRFLSDMIECPKAASEGAEVNQDKVELT